MKKAAWKKAFPGRDRQGAGQVHIPTASGSHKDQKQLGRSSHTPSVDSLTGVERHLLNWMVTVPQRKEEPPRGTDRQAGHEEWWCGRRVESATPGVSFPRNWLLRFESQMRPPQAHIRMSSLPVCLS